NMRLNGGTWVHMTTDLGHAYEHALDHGDHIEVSGSNLVITPAHHEGAEEHGAHAEHGADAGPTQHELTLVLNKYTLERQGDQDLRKLTVKGEDAAKLMNNMAEGTLVFGANLSKNEYAVQQQYANFFFFITGFHGFHVFQGVIINLIIFLMALNGVFERRGHYEMVEKVGLFWHFVDLVWVFVFTFFYLV
ncbi:MAG: cytochrome c oxidase subunit 3, partial [Flavobacteriales bacterium]